MTTALLLLLLIQGAASPAQEPGLRFEVASVKPNATPDAGIPFGEQPADGIRYTNYPVDLLVRYAFELEDVRVLGLPQWTRNESFDIAARAARPITEPERRIMVRALLVERFGLRHHVEQREQTVLVMTMLHADRRLGTGLTRRSCEPTPCAIGGTGRPDGIKVRGMTFARLAGFFSALRRQLVYDETGVTGVFDVEMTFRPENVDPDAGDVRPSFSSAVEEQLGLKLTPQRRPVDVLVVDAVTRPTPD